FPRHLFNHVRGHTAQLLSIGSDKGILADGVDQAGQATRIAENSCDSLLGENMIIERDRSRDLHPLLNVLLCLASIQRIKLCTNCNSLLELSQPEGIELLVKFGLPCEYDLQQFVVSRF